MERINVFYTPKMSADSGSYSPSSAKPSLAVASWMSKFPINVIEPKPATINEIARAHDLSYVKGVLNCNVNNGFGNRSAEVASSLRYTVGAMIDATVNAIETGGITCAPVSGFHHACWSSGGGFCTFNGLMVAALDVLNRGFVSQVGILDCDMHYGNGTVNIIDHLEEDRIIHFTAGETTWKARQFLNMLPVLLETIYADCGVILYQAGADPHVNDPLGGWMTTDELLERDTIVFEVARELGIPLSWCLAGGYQRDEDGGISPVLKIHDNTMEACINASEK